MALPPHGLCGLPEQLVAGSGASVNLLGHCLDPRSLLGSQLPDAAGTVWQGRGDVLVTGRPIQGLAWLSGHKQCIPLHAWDTHPGPSFLPKKMHQESGYRFRNPDAACIWIHQENDRFFKPSCPPTLDLVTAPICLSPGVNVDPCGILLSEAKSVALLQCRVAVSMLGHDDIMVWQLPTLLTLCEGNPHYCPFVRGIHQSLVDSPHKGTVMPSFDVSLSLVWAKNNKSCHRWFETPWCSCDVTVMATQDQSLLSISYHQHIALTVVLSMIHKWNLIKKKKNRDKDKNIQVTFHMKKCASLNGWAVAITCSGQYVKLKFQTYAIFSMGIPQFSRDY